MIRDARISDFAEIHMIKPKQPLSQDYIDRSAIEQL